MVHETPSRHAAQGSEWLPVIQHALRRLDGRAHTILAERVFAIGASIPTLQELGDRFNLSRERVRQIEAAAVKELLQLKSIPEVDAVITRIRFDLGLVFSRTDLADAIGVDLNATVLPTEVHLLLFLAGPYQVAAETMMSAKFDTALRAALAETASGPVPLVEVRRSMRSLGIHDDHQLQALRARRDIRIVDEKVVPWSGTLGDKAAVVLALKRRLMTAEEIHEHIGEGSLTTLKNYLGSEDRFQRRGPRRWGLSEWGGERYKSIAAEMADELGGLPHGMPIERLKRILDEKFGIVAASVEIMSVTHPRFVRDGVWVRLRREDEPYVPDTALEEAGDCVVIEGVWAWRHLVTHDTLRGSGHIVPEAFAALLRLLPGGRLKFSSEFGDIPMYWPSQSPGIGSLRHVAESLGAAEGDYLFVVAYDTGRLGFRLVRQVDLSAADAEQELLLRLGQTSDDHAWLSACATGIGLSPHAQLGEVEELLAARGDRDVLRLFGAARRRARGG